MKVVILAGGLGTRLSEEMEVCPKPMIEIAGKPILWHIMKSYSYYGYNDFVILLGYKGYVIKEYFSNYFLHQSDVTIGHIGTSSFYPPHHITTGEGGAVYRMSTWGRARHFLKKEARA